MKESSEPVEEQRKPPVMPALCVVLGAFLGSPLLFWTLFVVEGHRRGIRALSPTALASDLFLWPLHTGWLGLLLGVFCVSAVARGIVQRERDESVIVGGLGVLFWTLFGLAKVFGRATS
jgi:hypothetical protein